MEWFASMHGHRSLGEQEGMVNSLMRTFSIMIMTYGMLGTGLETWQGSIVLVTLMMLHNKKIASSVIWRRTV